MGTRTLLASTIVAVTLMMFSTPATADTGVAPLGPDFHFGVAQSGFQSEGSSPDSNYLRYGRRGLLRTPIGTSVDFLHRFRDDIMRARSLGVDTYRMSVEWSRVQPRAGVDDPAGWAFYDQVIGAIVAAGMTPMITLNHWVHPGWEVDRGGWNRVGMADDFVAFATTVVDRYAWAAPRWVTFNEPSEYVRRELSYGGIDVANAGRMVDGIVRAHRRMWRYIHAKQPGAQVTSNLAFFPVPGVQGFLESLFPERMRGTLDVIGVDHYYSTSVTDFSAAAAVADHFEQSSQSPESIYYALRHIHQRFPGTPIWIVENGLATADGQVRPDGYRRADHLRDTIYWVQRARQDGIPVVGYNYWSLTDNYEWGSYAPRFGLYEVDVQQDPTLRRTPTDAVAAYREITAHHGVGRGYRPTRAPVPCSLVAVPDSCSQPVSVP